MHKNIFRKAVSMLIILIALLSSSCNEEVLKNETQAPHSTSDKAIESTGGSTTSADTFLQTDAVTSTETDVPKENEVTAVPIINIITDDKEGITSKSEYKSAKMSIVCDEETGFSNCDVSDINIRIRGRGNASWNQFPKKSYRIKLDESISLFGMKKDKDWLLVSNYADKSLMRNIVAHNTAKKLDNLEYTPTHIAVELYLNGEYMGVYGFAEKIEFGGGKLEYTADGETVDTSYLLEVGWDYNDDMVYGMNYFDTDYILRIVIKEPEFTKRYTPSGNYIINYMKEAENAVVTLNGYEEYIDVDSLIDYLIITEFTNNTENVFYRSCYMYKPSGEKLKFGPAWDFDMAFGNYSYDIKSYDGWCSIDNKFTHLGNDSVSWYSFLFKDPKFTEKFVIRWDEVKDELLQTALDTVDIQAKALASAQVRNFERWDIIDKKIGAGNVDHRTYNTYELQVEYLRKFINDRYNWIEENISEFRL